jgi:hypothetical protein
MITGDLFCKLRGAAVAAVAALCMQMALSAVGWMPSASASPSSTCSLVTSFAAASATAAAVPFADGVVSCGLDAFCYGLTLVNMLTGDLFCKPRVLLLLLLFLLQTALSAAA